MIITNLSKVIKRGKNQEICFFSLLCLLNTQLLLSQVNLISFNSNIAKLDTSQIVSRNPHVYNVNYIFELSPDNESIDRSKDLKLWLPVPREWDSQRAVEIISVDPEPLAQYEDPEHGNKMFYWDFGKLPVKSTYQVSLKYRFEALGTHLEINPDYIKEYDKNSKEYILYTRSTQMVHITPQIYVMAKEAISNETNPYLKAKAIFNFVSRKVRYQLHRKERGVGTDVLLNYPLKDSIDGETYYEGGCDQYHGLFVALCRAVGIPARSVVGFLMGAPWVEMGALGVDEKDLEPFLPIEFELSPEGLAGTQHLTTYNFQNTPFMTFMPHVWAEFLLPDYGWIPVDLNIGHSFGYLVVSRIIMSKDFDVLIGPDINMTNNEGYGFQWFPINGGRADLMQSGVWNIATIRIGKVKILHHPDPFPAEGYFQYAKHFYPVNENEIRLSKWREEKIAAFIKAEEDNREADLKTIREALLCDQLQQIVGKEKFQRIFEYYLNLRFTSHKSVPTEKFREIAENIYGASLDFFFKEWMDDKSLPQFTQDKYQSPSK